MLLPLRSLCSNKNYTLSLTGSLSFTGSLSSNTLFRRTLEATLSFAGSTLKRTGKRLSASISFSPALSRATEKLLSGNLHFSGSILKAIAINIAGTLSFVSLTIVHKIVHYFQAFTASISFSTSLLRRKGHVIPIVIDTITRFIKIVVGFFVQQAVKIEVPATVVHSVSIDVPSGPRIVKIVVPGPTSSVHVQA
jgi:hypothetical protein